MKGLSPTLLALAFVCFSLISLMSISEDWNSFLTRSTPGESRFSDLGLRFDLR